MAPSVSFAQALRDTSSATHEGEADLCQGTGKGVSQ